MFPHATTFGDNIKQLDLWTDLGLNLSYKLLLIQMRPIPITWLFQLVTAVHPPQAGSYRRLAQPVQTPPKNLFLSNVVSSPWSCESEIWIKFVMPNPDVWGGSLSLDVCHQHFQSSLMFCSYCPSPPIVYCLIWCYASTRQSPPPHTPTLMCVYKGIQATLNLK